MSDKKKTDEPDEPHVSFGEGDVQVIGFQQEADGHGWPKEELEARALALKSEQEFAVSQGVIDGPKAERDDKPAEKEPPKKPPVSMTTGTQSAGGNS